MTFGDFSDAIMVGILNDEERSSGDQSDLMQVCRREGIPAREDWIVRFINESRALGSGLAVGEHYSASLNANGRSYAGQLRLARQPKSIGQRLRDVPRSDWIALGALIVSLVALFR
ncbi:MAG: hypothetical protein AVDCRST_MAG62-515 [uncultured Sphingomonas sp.]|uniref:Uncharacterized protein n=1 Tax=uncultured Sphingomonas sp. TaxID=158754 RepID=A0A6J4T0V8_9SPHN|nr:MAG: hypothetical protein AVDCRST_MAG62-515 [uncultured Sphingomonas sp.]